MRAQIPPEKVPVGDAYLAAQPFQVRLEVIQETAVPGQKELSAVDPFQVHGGMKIRKTDFVSIGFATELRKCITVGSKLIRSETENVDPLAPHVEVAGLGLVKSGNGSRIQHSGGLEKDDLAGDTWMLSCSGVILVDPREHLQILEHRLVGF